MNSLKEKQCSVCGIPFTCGAVSDVSQCWCHDFPPIFAPTTLTDCLCPACLKNACEVTIDRYVSTITPENAMKNRAKELPPTEKLIEGIDYYVEEGVLVFKPWYHLKRGFCCENQCRHCPYQKNKDSKNG